MALMANEDEIKERSYDAMESNPEYARVFNEIGHHAYLAGCHALEIFAEKGDETDPVKISRLFEEAVRIRQYYPESILLGEARDGGLPVAVTYPEEKHETVVWQVFEQAELLGKVFRVSEALQEAARAYVRERTHEGKYVIGNGHHAAGYFRNRALIAASDAINEFEPSLS
ncbi:MAG: hypothetical protein AAF182_01920 [Pseudomonadota bacterium]